MASLKSTSRVRGMPNAWVRGKGFGVFFFAHGIVVYGLTRKTKDQLSVIDINNDATGCVVQCFLINHIPFAQACNARVTRPFYFLKGLAMLDYGVPSNCGVSHYHN